MRGYTFVDFSKRGCPISLNQVIFRRIILEGIALWVTNPPWVTPQLRKIHPLAITKLYITKTFE